MELRKTMIKRATHTEAGQEVQDVATEYHDLLRRQIRIIMWITVVLFVIAIASIFRSYQIELSVEKLDTHTEELAVQTKAAREAAIEARDSLQKALKEAEDRQAESSPTAIRDALLSIARIETYLCGGPCEAP
jgi:hypothetical protein